jgi:hypothetical protein
VARALAKAPASRQGHSAVGSRLRRDLAFHDWLVGGFVVLLAVAVLGAGPHPLKPRAATRMVSLAVAVVGTIVAVRGGIVAARPLAPLLYRTAILGAVLGVYFVLRDLAPVVRPHALDAQLRALDVLLFGGEPAVWMQRFVTPASTEWFAFFYLSYFWMLAAFALPITYGVDREPLIAEFATGMFLVYCIGQTLYLIVPGVGPLYAFPDSFAAPLPRGPIYDALLRTVAAGGAMVDIFPSLHTAGPLFMASFAFRHRRERWLGIAWPIAAFFAANILVATLILRWHYAIDVVAGIALGLGAFAASTRLPARESARRQARGASALWPARFPADPRTRGVADPPRRPQRVRTPRRASAPDPSRRASSRD